MNIRVMTSDDIPFAMRLKAQNHWNQLEADWQRQLLLEPGGCFVAESNGERVGTACACVFDDVAWVNFVLVDQAFRGRGIGSAMMRHILQWLDQHGVPTIRLDATSLGQPVYEKLGFVGDFTLHRYEGILDPAVVQAFRLHVIQSYKRDTCTTELVGADDLLDVFCLDKTITRTKRAKLLRALYDERPQLMRKATVEGHLAGYALCRPGSNAWQLGPIQGSPDAGCTLFLDVAERFTGERVYLDIPVTNADAHTLAQSLGLSVQRSFLRMTRGQRIEEDLQRFWAGSGPEKG